jgi:hypothetical protein
MFVACMDDNNPIGGLDLNQPTDGDVYMEDQGAKITRQKEKLVISLQKMRLVVLEAARL